jgi:hypothetical protein
MFCRNAAWIELRNLAAAFRENEKFHPLMVEVELVFLSKQLGVSA